MRIAISKRITVYAGSRIDERQRAAGVSDPDLCRGVGITSETLRQWKSGKYAPNASKLGRLSDVLDCTPNDFFVSRTISSD